ncbi:MAG: DUF126 domain-containing protein [Synergistaceae bacterium]|nr:DUF126 domain-containing protein [Synergistaceae bacterium]
MSKKIYKCQPLYEGNASGKALISEDAVCFHLVDPQTGCVVEKGHKLYGKPMEGTVLVAHSGKGSSIVQMAGLYEIVCTQKAPAAVIVRYIDPVLATALLIMEVPSVFDVEESFYEEIKEGQTIRLSSESGTMTITVED